MVADGALCTFEEVIIPLEAEFGVMESANIELEDWFDERMDCFLGQQD